MAAEAGALQASDFERPLWRDLTPWIPRETAGRSGPRALYLRARATDDAAEAARLLHEAAQAGHVAAAFHLALAYQLGRGVQQDLQQAAEWYRRARGNVAATYNLAYLSRIENRYAEEASCDASWLQPRAEAGDVLAQFILGVCCEQGGGGAARDPAAALHWYGLAVAQDHDASRVRLARMLREGKGVSQDLAEAARLFRAAADQEVPEACFALGEMLRDGEGIARDEAQAVDWLQKAVELGHEQARPALRALPASAWQRGHAMRARCEDARRSGTALPDAGEIYEIASLVDDDRPEGGAELALALFLEAARLGHSESQLQVGFHYLRGFGAAQDTTSALAWYRKSADQANANACADLARLYEEGEFVPRDPAQAEAWYRKAAGAGSILAQEKLGMPVTELARFRSGIAVLPPTTDDAQAAEDGELTGAYRESLGTTIVATMFLGTVAAMVLAVDGSRPFAAVLGAVIAFLWVRSYLWRVDIHTYALVRRTIFGRRTVQLGPDTHFHYRCLREAEGTVAESDVAYVLVDDGRTRLRLGGNMPLFHDLHLLLKLAEERDFLSRAAVACQAGTALDFGALRLAGGRVHAGKRSLKFAQVSSVASRRGQLEIRGPGGKMFLRTPLVAIPNAWSLLRLLEAQVPLEAAHFAPPDSTPDTAGHLGSWLNKLLFAAAAALMCMPVLATGVSPGARLAFLLLGLGCVAVLARLMRGSRVPPHAAILRDHPAKPGAAG